MFNTYMRQNYVSKTVKEYVAFLKDFTEPKEDGEDVWPVNDYPLLELNLTVNLKWKPKKG